MWTSSDLGLLVVMWAGAAALILYGRLRNGAVGAGLVLAYVLDVSMIHLPGAIVYLLPWYGAWNPEVVEAGFRQSTWGMLAFTIGGTVLGPRLLHAKRPGKYSRGSPPLELRVTELYIVVGLVCSLVLLPLLGRVPTVAAVVAAGWNLVAVGLGLGAWMAWQRGRRRALLGWTGATLCVPLVTILSAGFLGYGVTSAIAVLALVATYYRPRWKVVGAMLILGYLGLSFYVTYMRDRDDIRDVVWGGESVPSRIDQLYLTISTFEWFNPYDDAQLERIDDRLNQNYLVGLAVDLLTSRSEDFARGETVVDAVQALIPRAIWSNKPLVAGSMGLVSRYTGIEFAEDTSVGLGQVLEFYINFGTAGVIVGFLMMGATLTILDAQAGRALVTGDWRAFTLWYLPGLAFLQVGGSLVEITSSAAAATAAALFITSVLGFWRRGRSTMPDRSDLKALARPTVGFTSGVK